MEKLTLTRKEAAKLLGISTATVTQWVLEGRLKAYRVSDRPKSPYLFTREMICLGFWKKFRRLSFIKPVLNIFNIPSATIVSYVPTLRKLTFFLQSIDSAP